MSFFGLDTYELINEKEITDIHSQGYVLKHKKSGARVVLLSNDDENKAFYIAFRTPPTDETGVPHIIEHSVLCGSEKFPLKDPFVELVKGSLNTFLNAMTYPDKTIYPVASCNDQDFKNLMDVYFDAVLRPNILKYKEIFQQEGWHYELENVDEPLTINGVVYNEMKGAYSSADQILMQDMTAVLFPDNTYGKNSGGNPDVIPNLTYEAFLEFYKKYYHPSNSYIYLYGDFDIKERLEWMDQAYLSAYDQEEIDSEIKRQAPFAEMKEFNKAYPISSEESEEDNTYLAYCKVVGEAMDKELCQAMSMLNYALVSAPGAPVRQALIDAGIGKDIHCSFDDVFLQPMFSIIAQNANGKDKERFVSIIEDTLRKVVAEGVNQNALLGAVNSAEFAYREADYGALPKGLLYGILAIGTWVYDDSNPFASVELLDVYAFLRNQIGTDYFEKIIEKYLLNNTHGAVMMLEPKKGLAGEIEKKLEEKLAAHKATLSVEELQQIVEDTKHLEEYQDTPATEEELASLPMLKREDLRKEVAPIINSHTQIGDTPVVCHDIETNGIDYINFMFDISDITKEELPYIGFLRNVMAFVDTENYGFSELNNAINIHSGGITSGMSSFQNNKTDKHNIYYEFRIRTLEDKLPEAMALLKEVVLTSDVQDAKRILEILFEVKSQLQLGLSASGDTVAVTRGMSYFSENAYLLDATRGITYYDAICAMEDQFLADYHVILDKLESIIKKIFVRNRLMINFTAPAAAYDRAKAEIEKLIQEIPMGEAKKEPETKVLGQLNEGFTDASAIQYVTCSGNFKNHGFEYSGAMSVLKMILNYDYLWNHVRVKGGAYGCSCGFSKNGDAFFSSYRDPNLSKTLEVYEGVGNYIHEFDADEQEMTKYIIGTIGAIDTPLTPEAKGQRSLSAYIKDVSEEELQKERNEILGATAEQIRQLEKAVVSVLQDNNVCVVGNENTLRKEADQFKTIRSLYE